MLLKEVATRRKEIGPLAYLRTCRPRHHMGMQVRRWAGGGRSREDRGILACCILLLHIGPIGPSPPLLLRLLLSQPHARITGPSDRYHQQPRTGIASPLLLVAIGLIGLGLWYGFALRLICPRLLIGFCFGNCLPPGFGTAHLRAYVRKCIPFG